MKQPWSIRCLQLLLMNNAKVIHSEVTFYIFDTYARNSSAICAATNEGDNHRTSLPTKDFQPL